jgi:hypothetical protein
MNRKSKRRRRTAAEGRTVGRRAARWFGVGAAAAVVAGILYLAVNAGAWRLDRYTIRGASYMTSQEVLAAAGLAPGDNLFKINVRKTEGRLTRHPRIRAARVSRRVPGEVVIAVEERAAAAALTMDGKLYKISYDGVVLEAMTAAYEDVPPLVGRQYRGGGKAAGKRVGNAEVTAALAVLQALGDVDPRFPAAVDFIDLGKGAVVLDGGRREVIYGPRFSARTARRLRSVFEHTVNNGSGVITYDVRFGNDVVVTGLGNGNAGAGGDSKDVGPI